MKTKKSFKKKHKTKKHKIHKHKQSRKNNKTKKYLGSGLLDKLVTTGLSKVIKKQNIAPLSTVATAFSGTTQKYTGPNLNPLINNVSKIHSLKIKEDIKKSFNQVMNKYDESTSLSVPHVEMNEYGRYPLFFKKVPESQRKPGDIEPYLNQGEEAYKGYKTRVGTEEYFRQSQYQKKLYKKNEDEKEDEDENKEDEFIMEEIDEIDDFVQKSPEAPQLIQNISKLFSDRMIICKLYKTILDYKLYAVYSTIFLESFA
jgi:hypothetical protein